MQRAFQCSAKWAVRCSVVLSAMHSTVQCNAQYGAMPCTVQCSAVCSSVEYRMQYGAVQCAVQVLDGHVGACGHGQGQGGGGVPPQETDAHSGAAAAGEKLYNSQEQLYTTRIP